MTKAAMSNRRIHEVAEQVEALASFFNMILCRTCCKCGRTLPLDAFHAKAADPAGIQSHCIKCGEEENKRKAEEAAQVAKPKVSPTRGARLRKRNW